MHPEAEQPSVRQPRFVLLKYFTLLLFMTLQDETYFDAYNKRFGDLHGPVTFEPFREAAEDFKAKHLYSHIADSDERELVNALWLRGLTDTYYK